MSKKKGKTMTKLITITSDFGDGFAAAQLRAVTNTLGYTDKIIENHDVSKITFQLLKVRFKF